MELYLAWSTAIIAIFLIILKLDVLLFKFTKLMGLINKFCYIILILLFIKVNILEWATHSLERSSFANPFAIVITLLFFTIIIVLNLLVLDKKIEWEISKVVRDIAIRETLNI